MAKTPKRPRDTNQLAKFVVDVASGQVEERGSTPEEQDKNPSAVRRGHLGGIKGGKARLESLTPEVRVSIAKNAAQIRWRKKPA